MSSPTTPTHGKLGAIFQSRKSGFIGSGLNDVTWGQAATNAATAYYEIEIDALGTPDTFKWRKNGWAYTTGVSITGAAQTLDEGQTITFAATTGHTEGDKWAIGNLVDEPCSESGVSAQITETTRRILNPEAIITFTDSGGETVLNIDHASGTATFGGNVTTVTVSGNNAFIPAQAVEKVGYITDWNMDVSVQMEDITPMGDNWEDQLEGLSSFTGGANSYFIGSKSFFEHIAAHASAEQAYFLLKLFNYDPDQDGIGDHHICWVNFNSLNIGAPLRSVVKEAIGFKGTGKPYFVANS